MDSTATLVTLGALEAQHNIRGQAEDGDYSPGWTDCKIRAN